jgi:serine/threonine protein kinase
MTPERHQQIGRLYHAALELEAHQRDAFLDQACSGDAELNGRVRELLIAHERAGDFMESTPLDVVAGTVAQNSAASEYGQMIGHYRILGPLERGGMGEVCVAQDTKLRRKVALKLLPPASTENSDHVFRFEQEARAASALNHPNIITIYEIGQAEGARFIAAEYVDGETLRRRMERGPLELRQVLDVAAQVASALTATHEAGILHRDIKPENLIIKPDGTIKVLDFGVAKLIKPSTAMSGPLAAHNAQTTPGLMIGTIGYMSPEQVKGQKLDGRTDLFSLGVVLYEMIAGTSPFSGDTVAERAASILHVDPPPLRRYLRDVPRELERIVTKVLAKNPEERYQGAKDLLIDLRDLRLDLEVKAREKRSELSGDIPSSREFVLPIPSAFSRALFLFIQVGYLAMYIAALNYLDALERALVAVGLTPTHVTLALLIIVAMCCIAVRIYLISAVGWGHPAAGEKFRRLFPILLLVDGAWSAAPMLTISVIGWGAALAGVAGLAYLPFAQRTLVRSIYPQAP